LQLAPVSRLAPIDKASLALTILLAWSVLEEPMTWRAASSLGAQGSLCAAPRVTKKIVR